MFMLDFTYFAQILQDFHKRLQKNFEHLYIQ
jgi:hypothetical protein